MLIRKAALLVALSALLLTPQLVAPPEASAQRDGSRALQRLTTALSSLRAALNGQRRGNGPLAQMEETVARLNQTVGNRGTVRPRTLARLEQQHRTLRARLLARHAQNDRVIDAWEEVVIAKERMRNSVVVGRGMRAHGQQQQPQQYQQPPQQQPVYTQVQHRTRRGGYEFSGSFEGTPVRFQGRSVAAVHAQCQSFMNNVFRTVHVDDIVIFGAAHRNGPGFWSEPALCSIVALNTRGPDQPGVTGKIENEVPFSIAGDANEVRQVLANYLPSIMPMHVDDVTVNGQQFRNGPAFWNAAELSHLISSQAPNYEGRRGNRRRRVQVRNGGRRGRW